MAKKPETIIPEMNEIIIDAPAKPENRITLNVKIMNVSSPETLKNLAESFSVAPTEIFVRVTFEHKGAKYTVSNKLKYLTKAGYKSLLEAKEAGTEMKISINTDNGFFYIVRDVGIDDLFGEIKAPEKKSELADLASLLN